MLAGNGQITVLVNFLAPAGASSSSAQTSVQGITAAALTINLQSVLSLPGISAASVAAVISQPSAQPTLAPTSIDGGLEQVSSTEDTTEAQTRKYWYVLLLSSGMFLTVLYAIHRYYFRICSSTSSSSSFGSTRGAQLLVDRDGDFVPTDPKRLQV
jgi:hypothetical protein